MWNEIVGAQLGLLLEVQKAWVREVIETSSRWKIGRIVKRSLNIRTDREVQAETFACRHCGRLVPAVAPGARLRSHCPHCLWSLHVENGPIASAPECKGQMEPVAVAVQAGAWSLVHRCRQCTTTQVHSIAVDDNGAALLTVAARPAMQPAAAAGSAMEA